MDFLIHTLWNPALAPYNHYTITHRGGGGGGGGSVAVPLTDFVMHSQGENQEKGYYTSDGLNHSHRGTGRYTTDGLLHLHTEGGNGLCSAGGLFHSYTEGTGSLYN